MQPLTCAIALAVDDYVRARVVRAFDLALMCAVQTVLLVHVVNFAADFFQ